MTGLFSKPPSEKTIDKTDRTAETNPLRRESDRRKSPVAKASSTVDATRSGSQQSAGKQAVTDRQSLIRTIIDTEMKDASPAERDAMYQDIKGLDPAFARQVLSTHRLVRQMGQHSPGQQPLRTTSTATDSKRGQPATQSDSHSRTADLTTAPRPIQTETVAGSAPVVPTAGVKRSLTAAAAIGATPWPSDASSGQTTPVPSQFSSQSSSRRLPLGGRHNLARPTIPSDGNPGSIGPTAAVGYPESDLRLAEWHDGLTRLIARAETAAARNRPGNNASPEAERDYIQKQVYLRMLYLMNDQRARSIEPIYGIDASNQEFWQQMFWAISGYFDHRTISDPRKRATETLASLQKAVRDLQPKAELKLANSAFCHKITSYGNYETFDRNEFRPGRPVLLYVEIENFASERTANNRFRTILKSTIEIMDPSGNVLQKIPFPATEDLCRNYRRDYFHSYEFSIPETRAIGFGPHKVRLTVQDEISGQLATYTLNFNVTSN